MPFVIGVLYGIGEPAYSTDYLREFISEIRIVMDKG